MGLIKIYDTTLRDGTQAEDVSVSSRDKIKISKKLDEMSFDYIEGGWPGSNPKDMEFFTKMKKEKLNFSKLVAFGSTKRAGLKMEDDPSIQSFLKAETPVVTVFGKTWDFHVTEALKISLEENLEIIKEAYFLFNTISSKISLSHIKAHAGAEGNELADRMTHHTRRTKEPKFLKYDESIDVQAILSIYG